MQPEDPKRPSADLQYEGGEGKDEAEPHRATESIELVFIRGSVLEVECRVEVEEESGEGVCGCHSSTSKSTVECRRRYFVA